MATLGLTAQMYTTTAVLDAVNATTDARGPHYEILLGFDQGKVRMACTAEDASAAVLMLGQPLKVTMEYVNGWPAMNGERTTGEIEPYVDPQEGT